MLDDKVALVQLKLGHLAVLKDRDQWLRSLVELCSQAVDAERCTIWLVDHEKRELWARLAQRTTLDLRLPLGSGLAGAAAQTGETINVPDAYADPRFDRSTDLRSGYRTMNMLCVPVSGRDGRTVVGVIQVLNKRSADSFERRDQMLLERVSEHIAATLEQLAPSRS